MLKQTALLALGALALAGCARLEQVGRAPDLTPISSSPEHFAIAAPVFEPLTADATPIGTASLWTRGRGSLLGDRRAQDRGDILTVVIEIDESAEIENSTNRSRSGSESLAVPDFFGIPQRINERLPEGASLDPAVSLDSGSASRGQGGVSRQERLTLRVAATVVDVLPSGVLQVEGRQEVRVNFELRELLVTGYVRPEDVSRQNEITYDKIAAARISYGGRGQITDVQQPRIGQQIADIILPF
ncbi:flagellar basal body L-ring protein FlgH [Jannaschia seohaensis]|uniref:Flagellar L-ring protein n=1 Tax=Jannaschia seohaensis TaxID=475081 RepID=A0A2Y9B4B7_9RHOB|nr:flagellar basal body L-ring protein FlgH [Jannaschia seohaensis]PWJ16156.1 flagellar L-ring protein precursor FlgH [Jannaschia seohaensis]SSA49149.1 flagellar L-ring protein precursor FlgH [Jannaschia seohaensis]